jgi:hypothetical protein
MEKYNFEQLPSLHQLAVTLDIPYARLASAQVAYKPKVGEPYTKEINWDSVFAFIERRLDKTDFETVEDVINAALAVEYTPRANHKANPDSVWGKMLFGTTPMRKGHLKVGDKIRCKKTGVEGEVVFVNDTIVCYDTIVDEGAEKQPTSSIGNRVFNNQYEIITDGETAPSEAE